jgi:three-Cys-motif partner protein
MVRDIHSAAFDDATLIKLGIYEQYLDKWIPVFVNLRPNAPWTRNINIFDFFCGPGRDNKGVIGSPLIAIEACKKYQNGLQKHGKTITLHFSDDNKDKIARLKKELSSLELPDTIKYNVSCSDFTTAFGASLGIMEKSGNLLFIDQNGMKQVTEIIFKQLINLKQTDFLFFISSSYLQRFGQQEEFKQYLNTDKYLDVHTKPANVHRELIKVYKDMIPKEQEYYLAPFTLKKKTNIYGLIFGSGNLLGILKFLETAWSIDPERGEANFDIDGDRLPSTTGQPDMFKNNDKANKVQVFQRELELKILDGVFKTDKDIFVYSVNNGFLPTKHAKEVMQQLISSKKLNVEGRLRMGKGCVKEPRKITLN